MKENRGMEARILVVEDDVVLKRFYQQALGFLTSNYQVVGRKKEAISQLENHRFDMLITDLRMPGEPVMEIIRNAIGKNPDIQVLVASGYVQDHHYRKKTEQIPNIKGYLEKPFTVDELLEKVKGIIANRDSRGIRQYQ